MLHNFANRYFTSLDSLDRHCDKMGHEDVILFHANQTGSLPMKA